jgi:MerR family transcriptional regulator, copper efflux regulator
MENNIANIYLIKDLARLTGYSIYTIKYYLKLGLIKEASRSPETRYRYFDDNTVEQLKRIREMRRENKSIREIQHELF